MTWRLRITHRTGFRYAGEVTSSYNEARMTPITDAAQTALETRLTIAPDASTYRYWDYWGTCVEAFDVQSQHEELEVIASSIVESRTGQSSQEPVGWAILLDQSWRDRHIEWLEPTERSALDDELRTVARDVVEGLPPRDAAFALCEYVHEAIEYVPGATGVHSRVLDVWKDRKGVCQDIAHAAISLLRSVGIPSRYVSGYLHPVADAEIGEPRIGESHAWVEFWTGAWTPYDPTNAIEPEERHVVVGRGRDYGDVPPLKGVYSGPGGSVLGVTVETTRLA